MSDLTYAWAQRCCDDHDDRCRPADLACCDDCLALNPKDDVRKTDRASLRSVVSDAIGSVVTLDAALHVSLTELIVDAVLDVAGLGRCRSAQNESADE